MTKKRFKTHKVIYLIGSLRNESVLRAAAALRNEETEVFENWYSAGPEADDYWRDYERSRGHTYQQALDNHSAKNVYAFDRFHLNRAHAGVLVLPAGRSGHLEAGWLAGQGKPVFVLLDSEGEPERLDVMNQFLYGIYHTVEDLHSALNQLNWPKLPELPMVTIQDALWLAGLLEGDGSFCIIGNSPKVILQMTDKDTVERAARVFGSNLWKHPPTSSGKPVWACGKSGLSAVEWMRVLRPYMSSRRQAQIIKTVTSWLERRKYHKKDRGWWENAFLLNTRM